MTRMIKRIDNIAHHRNGCFGEPFYAVLFHGIGVGRMVASVFEGDGQVAVYALDRLEDGDIAFGSNSWRGDSYEPELRTAIAAYEAERIGKLWGQAQRMVG